jgi:DNA-binding MarR family transcriptional regulator
MQLVAETAAPPTDHRAAYVDCVNLIRRAEMRLADAIKDALDRRGYVGISAAQALMLHDIGEHRLRASDVRTTGCYLGLNAAYNLKKLTAAGLLQREESPDDKRVAFISLTVRGRAIAAIVGDAYAKHMRTIEKAGGINPDDLDRLRIMLRRLECFLHDQVRFQL